MGKWQLHERLKYEYQTNKYINEFSNLVVMTVTYTGNLILAWKIEEWVLGWDDNVARFMIMSVKQDFEKDHTYSLNGHFSEFSTGG